MEPTQPGGTAVDVGKRLAILRGERSQAEFAELLGISKPSLQRYEHGTRTIDADLIARLYVLFRVDLLWLLIGTRSDAVFKAPTWEAEALARLRALNDGPRTALMNLLKEMTPPAPKGSS